eukprot:gene13669-19557_t
MFNHPAYMEKRVGLPVREHAHAHAYAYAGSVSTRTYMPWDLDGSGRWGHRECADSHAHRSSKTAVMHRAFDMDQGAFRGLGSPTPNEPSDRDQEPAKKEKFDKAALMSKIKSYGLAGTLSYVITEIMFWAIALPVAAYSYHSTTGEWLSWDTDKAQLIGIAAGFVTVVRFAVPFRMAAAFALIPAVDKNIVQPFLSKDAPDS